MTFWSQERVVLESKAHGLVQGFQEGQMEHGAYALTVSAEYAITTANGGGEKRTASPGEHITIPPGQFALLLTKESVSIPSTALGLISIKSKVKLRGLMNVSGFHVDPGFTGQLKFSVYNAGNQSLDLTPGQPYSSYSIMHSTNPRYTSIRVSDKARTALRRMMCRPYVAW